MNKKTLNWMLMAAVVLGLSMNFTACSSDDDDEDNKEETPDYVDTTDPFGKNTKEGIACYNLLSRLAGVKNGLPDNWKSGATFDPVEGQVLDASQPFVRSVVVDDIDEAADYYNNLVDKNISSSTSKDSWDVKDVGTLNYTAVNQGNCFATIDVNVKQLPKLTQLRLIPKSAMDNNAAFDGDPYYSYGDVVKDKYGSYWICVRPCYQPKGTDTSYWTTFHNSDNVISLPLPGLKIQYVPTNMAAQKNSMKYLAQLLSILSRPSEFQQKVGSQAFDGKKGFAGLPVDPGNSMTNEEIVKVAQNWDEKGIWNLVKPRDMSVSEFKSYFNQLLTFIYGNYNKEKSTLAITYAQYNDASNFFRGTPKYDVSYFDMLSESFDIRTYVEKGTANANYNNIGSKALVVNWKNGMTLSETTSQQNISATEPIENVTTVYRFKNK